MFAGYFSFGGYGASDEAALPELDVEDIADNMATGTRSLQLKPQAGITEDLALRGKVWIKAARVEAEKDCKALPAGLENCKARGEKAQVANHSGDKRNHTEVQKARASRPHP
ncbi:unnamed protein product, partial [Amoebophrya sp. A120]|eukprot:GSA120T00024749001.1